MLLILFKYIKKVFYDGQIVQGKQQKTYCVPRSSTFRDPLHHRVYKKLFIHINLALEEYIMASK